MKKNIRAIFFAVIVFSLGAVIFSISEYSHAQEGYVGTKNCGTCHPNQKKTYDNHAHAKSHGGLKTEEGIGCETCHGPEQAHVGIGLKELQELKKKKGDLKILGRKDNKNMEMCVKCHTRSDNDNIDLAADDLVMGLQEYSELMRSKKGKLKMTCGMCHDHHTTAKDRIGIKRKCLDCHKGKYKVEVKIKAMSNLTCEDCHMPYAVKMENDTMVKEYHKGDRRSHIFGISVDPDYKLNDGTNHASLTKDGLVRLTVEMTCYACHKTGKAHNMTRKEMLDMAKKIH